MSTAAPFDHALSAHVSRALAVLPDGALVVGYSGGMDSHALLHALASNADARARGLRALHVDHGLHPDSAAWAVHCEAVTRLLDLPFRSQRVTVDRHAGKGIEDAARRARMAAFEAQLHSGEILALGHHRDDQAETILLKLLRGAGPQGLAGMRALRVSTHQAYLWRPLLDLPRACLLNYARLYALQFIDDPSNADTRLRRNFLRSEILPRLTQRWPDASAALAHSAAWARDAADFIDRHARDAQDRLREADRATLDWRGWLALPAALRDPVLRGWLRELRLDEPAHVHVAELVRQLTEAASDRQPSVRFATTELRRYRDRLYAMRVMRARAADWHSGWDGAVLALPYGDRLQLAPDRRFSAPLTIRYRRGGERLKPAGMAHTRDVRLLLQESAVPPWQRDRLPLVYAGDELIGVADLYLSDVGAALCRDLGARIVWSRA